VFMFFGSVTIYNNAPAWLLSPLTIVPYLLLVGGLVYLAGIRLARRAPTPCEAMGIEETPEPETKGVLAGARK
jgi:hypothetical protein